MSASTIAVTFAGCIFGGALLGMALGKLVPRDHLSADSRDVIKLGAGVISLMAALVLGLLVSAAKDNFDATNDAITQGGAKVILLDRVLRHYGGESNPVREELRQALARGIEVLWRDGSSEARLERLEGINAMELILDELRALAPQTDVQRTLRAQAQEIGNELLLSRWLQIEQAQTALPDAFLAALLFWLTMLYLSFGLIAPRNATVVVVLLIGALSLATAIFLILEMNDPMGGIIRASSGPMEKAVEQLGR